MRKLLKAPLLVLALLAAAPASAESMSVLSGRTVGDGSFVIFPQFGYPGVWCDFLYGTSEKMQLGGRIGFNYGNQVAVGLDIGPQVNFLLKFNLINKEKLSMALRVDPGLLFGGLNGYAYMGIAFGVGLDFGIHPAEMVAIHFGADLMPTMGIYFVGAFAFAMPIQFGPGVEFEVSEGVLLTFNAKFGPGIVAGAGGGGVGFALKTMMGVAIKM